MTHETAAMTPAMALALSASFGSVARWRAAFAAPDPAPAGGAAWRLLSFRSNEGRLVNEWAVDPAQAPSGGVALLAARLGDGGTPVETFLQAIDWTEVYERYQQAVQHASEGLGATADEALPAHLLDVRRAGVFAQSDALAAGAQWRDPAMVDDWAAQLPRQEPVVVYCVYGHEVGRATALRLRAAGIDARFLIGGFDGWRAQGRPLAAKPGA
jgi:Fe-Mn family superoxide dismutase